MILGVILLLVVGVWVAWNSLTAPAFLTPRVEKALSDALDAPCEVKGLKVSFLSGVSVDSLTIHPPAPEGEQSEPLVLKGIHLTHDLTDLILRSYRIESVEVQQLAATVSESTLDWTLARSIRDGVSHAGTGKPEDAEAPAMPRIALHNGTIRVALPGFEEPVVIDGLALNVPGDSETGLLGSGNCRIAGNDLWAEVRRSQSDGGLRVQFDIPSLNVGALPLPRNEKARKFLAHFETSGVVRGSLSVRPTSASDAGRPITGQISVEGLNAAHTKWGLGATNVSGQIQLGRHSLQAIGFSGLMNGAPFTIDTAELSVKNGKPHHAHLAGQVRHLDLGALPVDTLPHDLRKPMRETGVSAGIGDVEFRLEVRPEGKPVRRVKITTYEAEMKPLEVPLPMKNVELVALWREKGRLDIPRATATVHGARVRMSGYFQDKDKEPGWVEKHGEAEEQDDDDDEEDEGDKAVPHLTIEFEDVPATRELLESLPEPEPAEIGRKLGLTDAIADGIVRIDGKDVKFRLLARAAKMRSPEFPYPVESVAAEVEWSSEHEKVYVHQFTARHGGGALRGSAVANLRGDPTLNLQMDGARLPIDEHTYVALPDETREKLKTWGPEGHFDLSLSLRDQKLKNAENGLGGLEATVRLREVKLNRDDLGQVARNLNGTVYVGAEGFRVEDVTGVALGVPFRAAGNVSPSFEQSQLAVISQRLPFTEELIAGWPEPIAAPLKKLKPSGKFRIRAEDLHLVDGGSALACKLTLTLDGVDFNIGEAPAQASGTARLDLQRAGGETLSTSGTVHLDNLRVAGLEGKNLDGTLKFQNSVLTVPRCSVQAYGGTISARDVSMESDGSEWKLNARVSHIEIESLTKALGMEEPPTGVMVASFTLSGNEFDPTRMTAQGEIKCERGDLYTFPFILSVLRILDLRLPAESPATNALGTFELKGGLMHLEDMLLTGGSMPVHVQGSVGVFKPGKWKDQPVDMVFTLIKPDGLLDRVPIINVVKKATIDQLREEILQARVQGTVGEYDTQTVMEPLTAPVRALWGMLERISP